MNAQNILDLKGKQLTSLPDSFAESLDLEEIDLDQNQLTALPESIGRLSELKPLVYTAINFRLCLNRYGS
jgi:Leucine-rich repeat (LRR) protein